MQYATDISWEAVMESARALTIVMVQKWSWIRRESYDEIMLFLKTQEKDGCTMKKKYTLKVFPAEEGRQRRTPIRILHG